MSPRTYSSKKFQLVQLKKVDKQISSGVTKGHKRGVTSAEVLLHSTSQQRGNFPMTFGSCEPQQDENPVEVSSHPRVSQNPVKG